MDDWCAGIADVYGDKEDVCFFSLELQLCVQF